MPATSHNGVFAINAMSKFVQSLLHFLLLFYISVFFFNENTQDCDILRVFNKKSK